MLSEADREHLRTRIVDLTLELASQRRIGRFDCAYAQHVQARLDRAADELLDGLTALGYAQREEQRP
jgi:hypothetical protein